MIGSRLSSFLSFKFPLNYSRSCVVVSIIYIHFLCLSIGLRISYSVFICKILEMWILVSLRKEKKGKQQNLKLSTPTSDVISCLYVSCCSSISPRYPPSRDPRSILGRECGIPPLFPYNSLHNWFGLEGKNFFTLSAPEYSCLWNWHSVSVFLYKDLSDYGTRSLIESIAHLVSNWWKSCIFSI